MRCLASAVVLLALAGCGGGLGSGGRVPTDGQSPPGGVGGLSRGGGFVGNWPAAGHPSARPLVRARARAGGAGWTVDPDAPLARRSRWRAVLAVARRFVRAYLRYEEAEVGSGTALGVRATCTRSFARALLAHPATLPPGVRASSVRQVLAGVTSLWHLGGRASVLATVRAAGRGGAAGALMLTLVPRSGGWRVAGMAVY